MVVFCGINKCSPLTAEQLMQLGYRNVHNYADGFFTWRDEGHPVEKPDHVLDSLLYRRPQQVSDNVWSSIGATAPPSYANGGHNNNLSFVITEQGVLVVNAGDNYLLARAQHEAIPGRGEPTDMAEVTRYTLDYLVHMREQIGALIEEGATLADVYRVDQSTFSHLDTFDGSSLCSTPA